MGKQKLYKPRIDRWDIYNNLPPKGLTIVANKCKCSVVQVKYVLEGKRIDHLNIIKEAELITAIHIWKTRFCEEGAITIRRYN